LVDGTEDEHNPGALADIWAQLGRAGWKPIAEDRIVDTLLTVAHDRLDLSNGVKEDFVEMPIFLECQRHFSTSLCCGKNKAMERENMKLPRKHK
jgi:hypothetical protein